MRRRFPFLRLAASLCAGAFVFAAFMQPIHAAPAQRGGDAGGSASGYAVSGIRYELSAAKIDGLAGVSFRLDKPARLVRVGLDGTWTDCTVRGTSATCTFADEPSVARTTSLEVVATA